MKRRRHTLETCASAKGLVVVVDVLRAYTTACVAFARGAASIALVDTVDRARELQGQRSGALTVGEVDALPVPGFDYSNSPGQLSKASLEGRELIMRTSSGTQGVVRAQAADLVLCASLANATATATRINESGGACSFVITGERPGAPADEDEACADLIETMIDGGEANFAEAASRVRNAAHARKFSDPARPEFPAEDLEWACRIDWVDFTLEAQSGPLPRLVAVPSSTHLTPNPSPRGGEGNQ